VLGEKRDEANRRKLQIFNSKDKITDCRREWTENLKRKTEDRSDFRFSRR
jgi:hypothetical protein